MNTRNEIETTVDRIPGLKPGIFSIGFQNGAIRHSVTAVYDKDQIEWSPAMREAFRAFARTCPRGDYDMRVDIGTLPDAFPVTHIKTLKN